MKITQHIVSNLQLVMEEHSELLTEAILQGGKPGLLASALLELDREVLENFNREQINAAEKEVQETEEYLSYDNR